MPEKISDDSYQSCQTQHFNSLNEWDTAFRNSNNGLRLPCDCSGRTQRVDVAHDCISDRIGTSPRTRPECPFDNLQQPELFQPAVFKQLRGRGPLPRIPLQGTPQEVEELRDRGPFLDAIFERDCVDSSVHPFPFEESAYLCGKYWAVLTFLIEEGPRQYCRKGARQREVPRSRDFCQ